MLIRLIKTNRGQAAAEFALALIVLMPLILWMLRFGELLHQRHKTIEAARFAVWERAYGRNKGDIENRVKAMLTQGSLFSPRSDVSVSVDIDSRSTEDDFLCFTSLGAVGNMPKHIGLEMNGRYVSHITLTDELMLNVKYSLESHYSMIADPWNLTDRDNDGSIDDDGNNNNKNDLAIAIDDIYFWPAGHYGLSDILNIASSLQNNSFIQLLVWWSGQSLDLDPRGHPKLDQVPKPK